MYRQLMMLPRPTMVAPIMPQRLLPRPALVAQNTASMLIFLAYMLILYNTCCLVVPNHTCLA